MAIFDEPQLTKVKDKYNISIVLHRTNVGGGYYELLRSAIREYEVELIKMDACTAFEQLILNFYIWPINRDICKDEGVDAQSYKEQLWSLIGVCIMDEFVGGYKLVVKFSMQRMIGNKYTVQEHFIELMPI